MIRLAWSSTPLTVGTQTTRDRCPQLVQRQHVFRELSVCDMSRHSPHDAGCFILDKDRAAMFLNRATTSKASAGGPPVEAAISTTSATVEFCCGTRAGSDVAAVGESRRGVAKALILGISSCSISRYWLLLPRRLQHLA